MMKQMNSRILVPSIHTLTSFTSNVKMCVFPSFVLLFNYDSAKKKSLLQFLQFSEMWLPLSFVGSN